jgi:hypothetical protein
MSTNDPEFYQAPKFSPEQYQAPPRQRGCFFYGCIIASVLALLAAIFVGVLIFVGYRWVYQIVNDYTSTAPEKLPKVDMPAENRKTLQERVAAFRKAVSDGTAIDPLVLTSDDLNALIDDNDELKGTVYVKIEGDELKGKISFPLDKLQLPLPMVKGRYLNGEADLKASLFDGDLIVHIDAIEVNGKRPPEQFMTELRRKNVMEDFAKDPDNANMLRKIESFEIKDGKITIKARPKTGSSPSESKGKGAIPAEVVPAGSGVTKPAPSKNGEPKDGQPKPKAAAEPAPAPEPAKKP